jgi:hypothetical protein
VLYRGDRRPGIRMRYQQDYGRLEIRSPEFPDLLTVKDLEGILRIDAKTIYRYVQRGLIPVCADSWRSRGGQQIPLVEIWKK